MFDINYILKMAGVNPEVVNQVMTMKSMLEKLPKEKQTSLVNNFINSLKEAVSEVEGNKDEK